MEPKLSPPCMEPIYFFQITREEYIEICVNKLHVPHGIIWDLGIIHLLLGVDTYPVGTLSASNSKHGTIGMYVRECSDNNG
jgi:hypothetical protein